MTAVAEGAAVFANRLTGCRKVGGARKSSKGTLSAGGMLGLSFNYISRTPEARARVVANLGRPLRPVSNFRSIVSTPVGRPDVFL